MCAERKRVREGWRWSAAITASTHWIYLEKKKSAKLLEFPFCCLSLKGGFEDSRSVQLEAQQLFSPETLIDAKNPEHTPCYLNPLKIDYRK